jgi:DNA-binding MarR family transcriptional regulator
VLIRVGDTRGTRFDVIEVPALTGDVVDEVLDRVASGKRRPQLLVYRRGSPAGWERSRDAGLSYLGADGRVLLQAPQLYVDHDRSNVRPDESLAWDASTAALPRSPFAVRGSRVARWLLLHPKQSFAISELAAHVELSVAAVSRAVKALDEMAVVQTASVAGDARAREVRLERADALLNAWLPLWQRRRVRRTIWDVGTDSVEGALKLVASAAADQGVVWALGGLAGAAEVNRAVEPADALVWIAADDLPQLAKVLMPEHARGGRGAVRVAAAPDPWTLGLARGHDKLRVADPVQLWLDCSSEGERALKAADAVAEEMGW